MIDRVLQYCACVKIQFEQIVPLYRSNVRTNVTVEVSMNEITAKQV